MSKFIEEAKEFFDRLESGKGAESLKPFMAEGAKFLCDVIPIEDLAEYADWLMPMATSVAPGGGYDLISVTSNETQVVMCARVKATHSGEGGPVPPTNKSTDCHYVYIIEFTQEGKVHKLTKIWDQLTCFLQLGWPLPDKPSHEVTEKYLP